MSSDMGSAQSTEECTFSGSVFFYCCDRGYEHLIVCLAEGLKDLGIPFYSNINYWRLSPEREEYLLCNDPSISPDDCSVVAVSYQWLAYKGALPENLFHAGREYITVYLDDMDGPTIWNPEFRNFDFIFRTHYSSKSIYPSNCQPWVFGISNRILRETSDIPKFQERSRHLLVNFRVDQNQLTLSNAWLRVEQGFLIVDGGMMIVDYPLRKIFRHDFLPLIHDVLPVDNTVDRFDSPPSDSYQYLQWTQTGQRHQPNYYKRLKESAACAAVGGYVVAGTDTKAPHVEWWDSWRFWESLAAGCVPFHADFEKYGIVLPVMPENWRHYIGIDLDNLQETVERIAGNPGILERISTEGRRWAIENYGPVPTALRFLKAISSSRSPDAESNQVALKSLREINLIFFPDWCGQPEESVFSDMERVLRVFLKHPDKNRMTLVIDTRDFSQPNADLILSGIIMQLLLQEDLDVSDGPEILTTGKISEIQWSAVLPRVWARIVLENENKQANAPAKAENIPTCDLYSLSHLRAVQLETGNWALQ